jgi:hypothetical protein
MRFRTLILVLALAGLPACASAPPTYSTAGQKAFNADQLLKDIDALGQTARNLNATTGTLHLSDRDTAYVRDFSVSASAGLLAYGQGQGTLAVVVAAYHNLQGQLSADAKANDKFRFVLGVVDAAIAQIPQQVP